MPDRRTEHCASCPIPDGSRDCSCSRACSARVARYLWERICARVRSVDAGDWIVGGLAAALAVIAVATSWGGK